MKDDTPVAVTSRSFSRHPVLRKELLEQYSNVKFNDEGLTLSGDSLIEFLRGHVKAITALEVLDAKVFQSLPELRVVGKYGVGLDMIDLEAMAHHKVQLGWFGGVNKRSVSELVVSAAIALLHKVPMGNQEVRAGQWYQIKGMQLTGRTVGIIGCGHIGKDLCGLLKAFDCPVIVHDILDFPEFYRANPHVTPVLLENLLQHADIVTLHLPLDDSTRNILNAQRLSMLKSGACLINLARGNLLDEAKLKELLKSGHLTGAALDVFDQEPPQDMELLQLPNMLATPHIGGSTEEAVLAMGRAAIQGLKSFGNPLRMHLV